MNAAPLLVVVAGGPGAGKTTLLQELQRRGHAVMGDSARELIATRRRHGLPPRPAPAAFARAVFRRDLVKYHRALRAGRPAFFERCVLDAIGLLREAGALPAADLPALLASFRFAAPVFVLPPWREIYVQDAERDQTWDDAVAVHGRVVDWYTRLGLPLLAVPPGPVAQRADFVLDALALPR